MRPAIAAILFATVAALVAISQPGTTAAQDKKDEKKTQPKFDPPKIQKPDEATLKTIAEKTEELRKAVAALKEKKIADDVLVEVEIYLKAAENIVRFDEWYSAASGKWALTTLDQGLARAKQAEGGKAVWRDASGKWVVRAYRSYVDGSIQPYAVLLPAEYGKDKDKKWRLDAVLHGRDSSLTEAKFIATHQGNAPKDLGYVQLEPYGRGNNAYRWVGETDVFEAMNTFRARYRFGPGRNASVDPKRVVLRGFSMGGAGTWHLGLHHPDEFCVIGPGAGFTTTHGYVGGLPKQLPDYQEKCLHIYDAVDYAENAFNVPVVAYSGEKDAQKKAADNIENALKNFKEPLRFTHLIAPGLEHQMPKDWQEKAEVEYRKYADKGRTEPDHVRLVTYTPKYGRCDWVWVQILEVLYERAIVDAHKQGDKFSVTTTNVALFSLDFKGVKKPEVTIDGQKVQVAASAADDAWFEKTAGKWAEAELGGSRDYKKQPYKCFRFVGPIDDAFASPFVVVGPTDSGYPAATLKQFATNWDRYFRGELPIIPADKYDPKSRRHLVLFGDPQSNPLIAKVLPKLPITWTKDKLVVNGAEYDSKTHVPMLIYPNPLSPTIPANYVVINSGHTFKEADLKGTNALLYPRLGDWAVIKPTPTAKDPAAYEVVAAGLFDENWQFPKKK
jgi:hypothetical protein